jgi:hypothetical protein
MDECQYKDINDYKSAFKCFKQRFLVEKKSIFDLSDINTNYNEEESNNRNEDCCILTHKNIDYLIENFVNNGYDGSANSVEKFCYQLTKKHYEEEATEITINEKKVKQIYFYKKELKDEEKGAIEILATAIWLWRLPPSNTKDKGRMEKVYEILGLIEKYKDFNIDNSKVVDGDVSIKHSYINNKFSTSVGRGFAAPGMRYNMNKPNELAFIINFFKKCIDSQDYIDILTSNEFTDKLKTVTTYNYDVKIDKDKKRTYSNPKKLDNKIVANALISVRHGLLYLLNPDEYEAILSDSHKEKIIETFKNFIPIKNAKDINDTKLKLIKEILKKKLGNKGNDPIYFFYQQGIREMWQSGLDFKSNTILHGAPGTGKTYMTVEAIKVKQKIEKNSEYELVQFHPSYTYEDFMDGIKPTGIDSKNGQMIFKLKNGLFKQMCIDAFKELKLTAEANSKIREENISLKKEDKKSLKVVKKFYFIADEINRAELSRVFGELLLCLEEDKRLGIKEDGTIEGSFIKTQNSMMWEKNDDVVLFVDNNGKILEDSNDKRQWYFGVPENLFFIGTMNDIDRSVDSFDMALRRRFIWKHNTCDYDVIMYKYKDDEKSDTYVNICEELNTYITGIKGLNLGSSYELGHSYFMKPEELKPKDLNKIWVENIAPLLKEYIRAIESNETEIEKLVKSAEKIFKLK